MKQLYKESSFSLSASDILESIRDGITAVQFAEAAFGVRSRPLRKSEMSFEDGWDVARPAGSMMETKAWRR